MKIFATLRQAMIGWMAILRGEGDWARHFALTRPGLGTALALFFGFALLSIMLASAELGMPPLSGLVIAILVQSLSLLALLVGIFVTRRMVPGEASFLALLVPGIYALVAYLIGGTLLSAIGGPMLILLWLGLAVLFYVLGRRAGDYSKGVAAAFAVLTMVLLVGMPVTLYMLLGPVAAPTP